MDRSGRGSGPGQGQGRGRGLFIRLAKGLLGVFAICRTRAVEESVRRRRTDWLHEDLRRYAAVTGHPLPPGSPPPLAPTIPTDLNEWHQQEFGVAFITLEDEVSMEPTVLNRERSAADRRKRMPMLFGDYRDEDYYVLPRKFSIVARVEVKFPIEPRYRDRQHFILSDINGAKIEAMTSSYETVKHFNNLLHEKHVFKMHNVDFCISMGEHQFRHISGPMELYLTRQTIVEPYTVLFQMPPFPKHIFLSLVDIAEIPNRTLVDIMAIVVHLDTIHRTMWGPFRKIVVMDARWSLHAIKVWGDLLNKNALRWVLAKENCSIIIGTMFRRFRRQECLESSDYTTIHFNPFHHNNHHFELDDDGTNINTCASSTTISPILLQTYSNEVPDDRAEVRRLRDRARRASMTSDQIESRRARARERFFNGHFSFTTFNCEYDQNLASSRDGVYTFKAHGQNVMTKLANLLRENPYAETFRSIGQYGNIDEYRIDLNTDYKLDQRTFNTPTSSEVAAVWVEGTELHRQFERGVTLYGNDNAFYSIKPHHGCYDPLAYPLFFPIGELGWHSGIPKVGVNTARIDGRQSIDSDNLDSNGQLYVTMREYYCYKFQMRREIFNTVLHGQRLFQQFAVDTYIKLETTRLNYILFNQSRIRADLYQGLMDSVYAGEHRASALGKLWVLPASFIDGPRDMRRRYMDAFALVQKYVFKAKLDNLKHQLFKKHILGVVASHVYVIEFQKRGLPHAHFLLIMQTGNKLTVPDQYDTVISAELPDKNRFPELFDMVVKHMMHGPCGHLNMQNTCMKNGSCKCHYPRLFGETTLQGKDSYPIYRRRDDGQKVRVRGHDLDNRWVVPYNPTLLRMYDYHINVEVCSSIKAMKYIYKYIHKGHDFT
ncbi:hypothetical protein ZEAMMB73_Zm00001d024457 [Zea mays]|uniref:Helitron helicase-like domain-containing protein n=1 Tax=Zea mays TaxID=4577 RepID=A0A1D6IZC6_MAIZE|nr:hypothetical protein ZEAMMB73_Zm00001d024457 [Zea mays]